MKTYKYNSSFFDFLSKSSNLSSRLFLERLKLGFVPKSVLDVGCGRGSWLNAWKKLGVKDVIGLDGFYIDLKFLHIDSSEFIACDISNEIELGRMFDLAECLEVAEHIPEHKADVLIKNLIRHSNIILFSAATPGQGGEHHVNEKPLNYWIKKFMDADYHAYDYPRLISKGIKEIEPWYRYNTFLFANKHGQKLLSENVKKTKIKNLETISQYAPFSWIIRCKIISIFPLRLVNLLAKLKHRIVNIH